MADLPEPGQVSAIAHETLVGVAGLAPAAQVTAVLVVGAVAGLWIWTRRPQVASAAAESTMQVVAHAMTETAHSIAEMSRQNESVAKEMREIAEEVRGLTGIVLQVHEAAHGAPHPARQVVG